MVRVLRLLFGGAAVLIGSAGLADAQYYPYGTGYGGGGFGGFGGTVGGDVARGLGAFEAGAGVYNYDTAVANQINANTLYGINQYLFLSSQEAAAREHAKLARRQSLVNKTERSARQVADQLLVNPSESDVDSGAALNAILHQLSEPKLMSGSALRMANGKIDAKLIRKIPFRDHTDAVTISLDQLTDEKAWPFVLRDPKFDTVRTAYARVIDEALEEDKNGDLTPSTVRKVRQAVADLNRRVNEVIPRSQTADHLEAINYVKGLAGFSRMLEKPNVEKVLAELEKIDSTTVGHLIAFMHTYNLQFGEATTGDQKAAYQQLYQLLVATRDRMIGPPNQQAKGNGQAPPEPGDPAPSPGNVRPNSPTSIFHGMDDAHLHQSTTRDPAPSLGTTGPNTPGTPR